MIKIQFDPYKDSKLKAFQEKLIPGITSLGVSTLNLEKITKEILNSDPFAFLENQTRSFEMDMLYGFVSGYCKCTYEEHISYLHHFIDRIDNWAVCDGVCARQKWIKKNKERFKKDIDSFWTENPWHQRFYFVLLLDHYMDDPDWVLQQCQKEYQNMYYVQMALAWLISMLLIKHKEKTLNTIHALQLDNFTWNKALQKACESKRCTPEDRILYKQMKRP